MSHNSRGHQLNSSKGQKFSKQTRVVGDCWNSERWAKKLHKTCQCCNKYTGTSSMYLVLVCPFMIIMCIKGYLNGSNLSERIIALLLREATHVMPLRWPVIQSVTNKLQTQLLHALLLISGDFNHASLSSALPTFSQYVTCYTRNIEILRLCFWQHQGGIWWITSPSPGKIWSQPGAPPACV